MNNITLRAPGTPLDALLLGAGMHVLGKGGNGTLDLVRDASVPARITLYIDRRGVWLEVGEGVRGVHVNGRPVQRKAMLRAGDSLHVDGSEIVLAASKPALDAPAKGENPATGVPDPRVVLRGVGGPHHGRSFTLDHSRLVGSASDCDIRIDAPSFAARHARIGLQAGQVVLQVVATDGRCQVNGLSRRDALLQPGDQVVFDANHRFVVEAPLPVLGLPGDEDVAEDMPELVIVGQKTRRLPWLLLAALLMAAAISALLLL